MGWVCQGVGCRGVLAADDRPAWTCFAPKFGAACAHHPLLFTPGHIRKPHVHSILYAMRHRGSLGESLDLSPCVPLTCTGRLLHSASTSCALGGGHSGGRSRRAMSTTRGWQAREGAPAAAGSSRHQPQAASQQTKIKQYKQGKAHLTKGRHRVHGCCCKPSVRVHSTVQRRVCVSAVDSGAKLLTADSHLTGELWQGQQQAGVHLQPTIPAAAAAAVQQQGDFCAGQCRASCVSPVPWLQTLKTQTSLPPNNNTPAPPPPSSFCKTQTHSHTDTLPLTLWV